MRFRPVVLSTAFILAACSGAEFTRTQSAGAYHEYKGSVAVLWQFPPEGEYEQLGIVKAEGGAPSSESSLINALKEKAAKHGANAIVVQSKLRSRRTMSGTVREMAAYAIRQRAVAQ